MLISCLPALSPYKPSQDQNVSLSGGREGVVVDVEAGLPVLSAYLG